MPRTRKPAPKAVDAGDGGPPQAPAFPPRTSFGRSAGRQGVAAAPRAAFLPLAASVAVLFRPRILPKSQKFFDRVNHERLLARLEKRVTDRRLIRLIRRMLKAKVVMPDGVVVTTAEGTPQGGPLSPLLSNIVLDELDWEMSRRGYRFVRYADDSAPRRREGRPHVAVA